MKKGRVLLILLLSVAALSADSDPNLTAEAANDQIIGDWQLLSFERGGRKDADYSDRMLIWTFDGHRFSVESDDLGRRFRDEYQIKRSVYRIRNTIIILNEVLRQTHLPHGKLVIQSFKGDTMTITDWDGTVRYTLKRIK